MAILVDSNVFLDILQPRSAWSDWSAEALLMARSRSTLLCNVVIAAEVAYSFRNERDFVAFLTGLPIDMRVIPDAAAFRSAEAHKKYREAGGQRTRTLPDFLIGAHASVEGHSVLTRDPAGYRSYFADVELITPDTHP